MTIITLTTDWQSDDFYVGAVKGLIYSKCNDIQVVDITHKIESYKYTQAAFILKNAFNHFPEGTIHIAGINSDITEEHAPVCIKMQNQYFIGTSSGVFSLMFDSEPQEAIELIENEIIKKSSFPELTMFAQAAIHIVNGGKLSDIGTKLSNKPKFVQYMPAYDEDDITGSIIYIDSYQNIITNVSKELFDRIGRGRSMTISFKSDSYKITKIHQNYSQVDVGEILAIFNSLGFIEIAMRNARLAQLIDIKVNSPITIKFN